MVQVKRKRVETSLRVMYGFIFVRNRLNDFLDLHLFFPPILRIHIYVPLFRPLPPKRRRPLQPLHSRLLHLRNPNFPADLARFRDLLPQDSAAEAVQNFHADRCFFYLSRSSQLRP